LREWDAFLKNIADYLTRRATFEGDPYLFSVSAIKMQLTIALSGFYGGPLTPCQKMYSFPKVEQAAFIEGFF
jgi:hypothetical protein